MAVFVAPECSVSAEGGVFAATLKRGPVFTSVCGSKEAIVEAKSATVVFTADLFPVPLEVSITPGSLAGTGVGLLPGLPVKETEPGKMPTGYSFSGETISAVM